MIGLTSLNIFFLKLPFHFLTCKSKNKKCINNTYMTLAQQHKKAVLNSMTLKREAQKERVSSFLFLHFFCGWGKESVYTMHQLRHKGFFLFGRRWGAQNFFPVLLGPPFPTQKGKKRKPVEYFFLFSVWEMSLAGKEAKTEDF